MDLCSDVGEDRLPEAAEMELVAMLMDSIPLERIDKNILLDFIEDAGEATFEKYRPMAIVLDLLQKKLNGDKEMIDMVCDMRISMYETIGLKDEMRCTMAQAYMQKAMSLKDMNILEDSFAYFYGAYQIFDAAKEKNDASVADAAYTSYMVATLANELQIGVDHWHVLSHGVSCMALLLYYRRGWDQLSWLMERILGYMEALVSLPEWEDKRNMYKFHREEYEGYLKNRRS